MPTSIITTDDLREFKTELLDEIKELLTQRGGASTKKWLKSTDVMKLLKISPGTLQNLRINGTIPYTKIGGLIYYDSGEIERVMEENRVQQY